MKRVLLTGANGFLGTQIARQLISNPEIKIITIIRAKNKSNALERLKRAWYDWPELIESLQDKVEVLPGDITKKNLGLNEDDFKKVVSNLSHIIHTAADLRLHTPLEELRKTNLQGTRNLIKIAHQATKNSHFEGFSHISTAYVAGKRDGIIREDELSGKDGFWSNYEESKYEAEQTVRESGLPFVIFRPGMIVGDSKTGEIKTFNTIYALLRLYLTGKLRLIPTSPFLIMNMVPVDYVASAVSNLTFNPQVSGKTFHLTTPHSNLPNIRELLEEVRKWAITELDVKLPHPIFIPISLIVRKLSSFARKDNTRGIFNILITLAPYLDENRVFNQDNIREYWQPCPLDWKEYLPNLLNFAVYHGFFHRSERTVHEQVLYRLKSRSYPVKYYDVIDGKPRNKPVDRLENDIIAALNSLKVMKLEKGDRVAIVGFNSTRYLTVEVAVGLLGAVSVPLYYTSPPVEIENILKACQAKVLFIGSSHLMKRLNELDLELEMISFCREDQKIPETVLPWQKFLENGKNSKINPENIQAPVEFNELATIRYTSGTTGKPKGVSFNHHHLVWMAESMASLPPWKDRNSDVRYLSFLPMNHVVEGILGTFSPYYAPASIKIYFLENFHDLAISLPKVKPTIFFSVPRFYEKLWKILKSSFWGGHCLHMKEGILKTILKPLIKRSFLRKAGLNHCAQLIVGSATSSSQMINDYHDFGIEIHNAYGLTEAPLVTLNRKGKNKIGTVGEPLPETKIRTDEDGEILVKGPQVTLGYFKTDSNPPMEDGWLKTGDLGYLTSEGSLVITGRKKELIINSYGKSIDPLRIEALLRDTPGVNEVMLVGEGKPYLSSLLWADSDYNPEKISKSINEFNNHLSHPEQVKKWVILSDDLSINGGELTANMKLKRKIITKRYQNVIDSIYIKNPNNYLKKPENLILHFGHEEADDGI